MRVLIIEDNVGDYYILLMHLHSNMPEANPSEQITRVDQAIKLHAEQNFDIILLDLNLPDSSGAETLEKLSSAIQDVPIIILSGLDDEKLALNLLQKGAQDYILKDQLTASSLRKSILHSLERYQMSVSLNQLANRYHHILQASVDILFEYDLKKSKLHIDNLNSEDADLYNLNATEPIELLSNLLDENQREEVEQLFEKLMLSSLISYRHKFDFRQSGNQVDVELNCTIFRDGDGFPQKVLGSLANITNEEEAWRQANLAKIKYSHLFDHSPVPSFIYDRRNLKIIDCSETALKLYGFPKNAVQQLLITELWSDKNLVEVTTLFLKERFDLLRNGYHTHSTVNGELFTVSLEIIPSNLQDRDIIYLAAFDQSEKLNLERQLANEKLEQQKILSKSIIKAQENERSRIGGELHDNINQMITSALLFLQTGSDIGNKDLISRVTGILKSSIEEVRKLSQSMVSPIILDVGLKEALEELIYELNECQEINFTLVNKLENIPDKQFCLNIYRIIQEQTTNTIKYSKGTQCTIFLYKECVNLKLVIEDNGIGCNSRANKKGIGLLNIQTRIELYGGTLEIGKSNFGGFGMYIDIPLPN